MCSSRARVQTGVQTLNGRGALVKKGCIYNLAAKHSRAGIPNNNSRYANTGGQGCEK